MMERSMEEKLHQVYDMIREAPEGIRIDEIASEMGVTEVTARSYIRRLRLILGTTDEMNIACDPQGQNEKWIYRLVGNLDDSEGWITNRLTDAETRLETIEAVSTSIVEATDGRTIEGRKARKIQRTVSFLMGELGDIEADGASV